MKHSTLVKRPATRASISHISPVNHPGRQLPARVDSHKEQAASGLLLALFEAFEHRVDHAARRQERFAPRRAAVLADPRRGHSLKSLAHLIPRGAHVGARFLRGEILEVLPFIAFCAAHPSTSGARPPGAARPPFYYPT